MNLPTLSMSLRAGESAIIRQPVPVQCSLRRPTSPPRLTGTGRLNHVFNCRQGRRSLQALSAAAGGQGEVYRGVYGPWSVEEADVKEVTGYRVGISVAAAALVLDSLISFIPDTSDIKQVLRGLQDPIAVAGAGGLGVSLYLIHIYVTPLKRFLQLLWGAGVLGALSLMLTQDQPVTEFVAQNPVAVWAIGPFFAAVTGVAFKEGLCYGKPECAALFFLTPTLLLGHLFGFLPEGAERVLLVGLCGLATVFAGRKYTQPIKDDIGDKSVFIFQALSPEEQEKKIAELQSQGRAMADWQE